MKLQCLIAIFVKLNRVILLFDLFLYDRIYDSDSRQVQDVTRRTFHVGEVDRFVQSHLDRADRLGDTQRIMLYALLAELGSGRSRYSRLVLSAC